MRLRFLALVLCMLSLPLVSASALDAKAPPGWTEANRDDNLIIFYKDNEAAGARELLAYFEVDAPPVAVYKVITDVGNYSKFMPYTKESQIVQRKSDVEVVSYQHLSPPLVSDRDYYIVLTQSPGTASNGGVYKSSWKAIPEFGPEKDGIVRVKLNQGSWTMEPIDGGKRTRVTYSLLTHPGGSIPRWIANKSNTTAIPDLAKAVRKRATGG